jgi:hypothetical protein
MVLGTSVGLHGDEVTIATPDQADVVRAETSVDGPDLQVSGTVPEPAKEATETTTTAKDPTTQPAVREELGKAVTVVSVAEESETGEPAERPEEPPDWRLQSIIVMNRGALAMINGQAVMVGEEVDGGLVREIARHAVVIGWRGSSYRLELREP